MGLDNLGTWVQLCADLDGPVLNGTGLEQQYKIDLHWTPDDEAGKDLGIMGALQAQAGIVLRKQDVPMKILVVDQFNRTPSPN